jgi:hypothetical protein
MKTNTASTTPPTPPEPQGSTVQEKLASARSIIADLFNRVPGLIARSGRGGAEQKRIERLFAKLNKEVRATQAKASHLAGEVASARAAYDIEHNRAERAARNEGTPPKLLRGERFGLENAATAASAQITPVAADLYELHQQLLRDEAQGKVKPGTALGFYRTNKAELSKLK